MMNDECEMMNGNPPVHRSLFIIHHFLFLPTRLRDSRYVSFERQFAEAYAAQREVSQISSPAAAAFAAVVHARREHVEIHARSLCALDRFLVRLALLLLDSAPRIFKRAF